MVEGIHKPGVPASYHTDTAGAAAGSDKVKGGVGVDGAGGKTLPTVAGQAAAKAPLDLAPGGEVPADDLRQAEKALAQALQAFAAAGSPAESFTGDIARLLSRIMIEQAGEARQNALRDRLNARDAAKADLLSQAGNLRDAASKMVAGAVANLVTGSLSGLLSIGAAGISLGTSFGQIRNMTSNMSATKTATETANAATEEIGNASKILKNASLGKADKAQLNTVVDTATRAKTAAEQAASQAADAFRLANAKADAAINLGKLGEAIGGLGKSIGSGTDAHYQAMAKTSDAQATEDAAEAQYTQQTVEMKKAVQDAASDMMKQIIAFIKELRDAEVEAMRAITRA